MTVTFIIEDHMSKLVRMKLDFPTELTDAIGHTGLIAGGAVLRRMLGASTTYTDIDVFFADKGGRDCLFKTAGILMAKHGFRIQRPESDPGEKAYIHERIRLSTGVLDVDLIYHERWGDWSDVLNGFDITAAQVGYFAGSVILTDEAEHDLLRREMRVLNHSWPTTQARVEKYADTFDLRLVGKIPPHVPRQPKPEPASYIHRTELLTEGADLPAPSHVASAFDISGFKF